jgi:hypothetical protein
MMQGRARELQAVAMWDKKGEIYWMQRGELRS